MRKLAFILLASALTVLAEAQTIHWLTFIDTTDKRTDAQGRVIGGVGAMDEVGRQLLYSRFVNVVNSALAEKGYKSDVHDYYGTRTTPSSCRSTVTSLKCEPEDIIVFYYIGHGGRPGSDDPQKYPYPQMYLAQHEGSNAVPLDWVHKQLKSKGARLTITIGMCCNVNDPAIVSKHNYSFGLAANYGASAYVANASVEAIQKLFLGSKGDLIATSASPTESSYGGLNVEGFGGVDDYTAIFIDIFGQMTDNGASQWDILFDNVGRNVVDVNRALMAKGYRDGTQTPFYAPNISSASAPAAQPREEPTGSIERPTDEQDDEDNSNVVSEYFDYVIDRSLDLGKRIEVGEALKSLFANEAKIKILGQDSEQVIDKESVDDYFSRVTTADRLLKIIPVDVKVNNSNKAVEMKVREYYRK